MYADFEKSIHIGAKNVWPDIITKGCRFHLGQAWWRKVQNLGLSTHYCDDVSEIVQFLKNIFELPMLKEHDIEMSFTEDFMSIKPNDEKLNQFIDYLVENYIDTQSDFPPHTWAEISSKGERTTNACESFHSKFNSCFYTPHPDIYSFLEILKKIQIDTKMLIQTSNHIPKKIRSVNEKNIKVIEEIYENTKLNKSLDMIM